MPVLINKIEEQIEGIKDLLYNPDEISQIFNLLPNKFNELSELLGKDMYILSIEYFTQKIFSFL